MPELCAAEDVEAYGTLIDEALVEYREGHFSEARALFWRAHSLAPSARTLRGIGMAEFELRSYVAAVRSLEGALASEVRALEGALRSETEALLARAFQFVGLIELHLEPGSTVVWVDGAERAREDPARLLLSAGTHVLEFRAQGFEPQQRKVDLHGGEREPLVLKLKPQAADAVATALHAPNAALQPSAAPSAARDQPDRWYSSPWLWAGVGVLVVGAGVGVGLAVAQGGADARYYGGDTNTLLSGP